MLENSIVGNGIKRTTNTAAADVAALVARRISSHMCNKIIIKYVRTAMYRLASLAHPAYLPVKRVHTVFSNTYLLAVIVCCRPLLAFHSRCVYVCLFVCYTASAMTEDITMFIYLKIFASLLPT